MKTISKCFVVVLLFASGYTWACDKIGDAIKANSPVNAFFLVKDCYGSNTDPAQLTKDFRAVSSPASDDVARKALIVNKRLNHLVKHAESLTLNETSFDKEAKLLLLTALKKFYGSATTRGWTLTESRVHGYSISVPAVPALNLATPISSACGDAPFPGFPTGASPKCRNTLEAAKEIARVYKLAAFAFQDMNKEVMATIYANEKLRQKKWDAYRDQALPQFQWEWFLNSYWINAKDDRTVLDDVKQGRIPIPNDQIIFMHPGVGLQYTSIHDVRNDTGNNVNDSELSPALFLEFIGYNRWRWDTGSGDIKDAIGVSIVGVVANNKHADDFSYGMMMHYRNTYSLAITEDSDNNTGIIFNFNLSNLIRDKINSIPGFSID